MKLCFAFVTKAVLVTHRFLVIAEQCLHNVKAFSVSHSPPPTREQVGMGKRLGVDTAGTADLD